jgi:hypothetical protein
MSFHFLAGETTKAYENPSVPGASAQPVTMMQALAAEAMHTALPKPTPFVAAATSSPRPQPGGHRSQERGECVCCVLQEWDVGGFRVGGSV